MTWSPVRPTDVKEFLDLAVEKAGVEHIVVKHRSRLLPDNGSAFVLREPEEYTAKEE